MHNAEKERQTGRMLEKLALMVRLFPKLFRQTAELGGISLYVYPEKYFD